MNYSKQTMRDHYKEKISTRKNLCMNPPLPESLSIEVNNTCNHSCVFCPYHGKYSPRKISPASLDVQFVKDILKQAWDLGIGKKEVGFHISGEPFLYNNLTDVVSFAKGLGYTYIFTTSNGALTTPDRIKSLLDAGLNSIRFSVNAPDRNRYKEIHGRNDFDTVVKHIRFTHDYIQQNGLDVATSISCVLTKQTSDIQDEIIEIFGDYVDDIAFIPVMLPRLRNFEEVYEKYGLGDNEAVTVNKDFICSVLFNSLYINAEGRVVPCCSSYDDNTYFFDLKNELDLVKAWSCEGFQRFRSFFLKGVSTKGTICETCGLRMKKPDEIITGR